MGSLRLTSRRWLLAFVVLAVAGVALLVVATRGASDAAQHGPGNTSPGVAGAAPASAWLRVTPAPGSQLTLAGGAAALLDTDAGAIATHTRSSGSERFEVRVEAGTPTTTLALSRDARWFIELGAGADRLRLDLERLDVHTLRVDGVRGGLDAVLPALARTELTLGEGRATVLFQRGSTLDGHLRLGRGATLLRVEPESVGSLHLDAGAGPTTIVVDATLVVALTLDAQAPPPLALEGTWWRQRDGATVTWLRAPTPAPLETAEVRITLASHAGAPLAVTYR